MAWHSGDILGIALQEFHRTRTVPGKRGAVTRLMASAHRPALSPPSRLAGVRLEEIVGFSYKQTTWIPPALLDMLTAPSQRHPWGPQPRASCSSDTWEQAGSLSESEWTPGHHAVSSCAQSALLRPPSSWDTLCLLSWGSPALFPALL